MDFKNITLIKKLIPLLVIILFASENVFSQKSGDMADLPVEEKAKLMTEMQNETLQFYDDQEQKMLAINLKYIEKMEKQMKKGRSVSSMKKLKKLGEEKDLEVKLVLDEKQYKLYKEAKEEMRKKRGTD